MASPPLVAQRALVTVNTNYTLDMLKNMTGMYTVPPVYDEYLANGTITQEQYDSVKDSYVKANATLDEAIKNAEQSKAFMDQYYAKLNETINGSGPGYTSGTSNSGTTATNNNAVGSNGGSTSHTSAASSSGSGINTASIIGIVLGAIATVVLITGLFLYHWRRPQDCRRRRKHKNDNSARSPTGDDTGGSATYSRMTRSSLSHGDVRMDGCEPWRDETLLAVRVPLESILRGNLLSRGGFGEVYRGKFKGNGVAIKMLLPERRKDVKQIKSFVAEIKFMAALDHPRIVTFVGVAWEALSDLCVVTEFMAGGDLRSLLSSFEASNPPHRRGFDAGKVQIALHVAHALTYLHSLQPVVVHRDLKSRNILLDADGHAKLTDFGVSRERSDRTMTAGVGSSLWMAPEVMMGERYDEKADLFSFGVVLSELDMQQLPYCDARDEGSGRQILQTAVLQLVAMGKLTISLTQSPDFVELQSLARKCVALDPRDRPTAAEALHNVHSAWKPVADHRGLV